MVPQAVEDVVQINIYGATLAGMLHNGVNLPRLLGKYGYSDCVVFDVPRRKGPWDHSVPFPSAISHALLPDSHVYEEIDHVSEVKEEIPDEEMGEMRNSRATVGRDPLVNCSLSTIGGAECSEMGHRDVDEDFEEGDREDEITPVEVKPLPSTSSSSSPPPPNTSISFSSSVAGCLLDLLDRVTDPLSPFLSNATESNSGNVDGTGASFDQWLNAQEASPPNVSAARVSSPTPTPSAHFSVKKEVSFFSQEAPQIATISCEVKSDSSEAPLADQPAVSPALDSEEPPISSTFEMSPVEAAGIGISFDAMDPMYCQLDGNEEADDIFMSPRSEITGRCVEEDGRNGEGEEFEELQEPMSPRSHSSDDEFYDCSFLEMNDGEDDDFKEFSFHGEGFEDDLEEKEEEEREIPLSGEAKGNDAVDEDDDVDMDEYLDPFDMNIPAAKRAKLFHAAKKFACHFENCKKEILWKPHYGRNRFLIHVQTHWTRSVFKCFFCDFRAGNEAKIRYHHKKAHAGTPWKKMVNCETPEDTEELLKLWRKCFPQFAKSPSLVVLRLNPYEKSVTGPSNLVRNAAVKKQKL